MTQETAAGHVRVSRATFAQWETGRHLPTEQRLRELDELFAADGELVATGESARAGYRPRPVTVVERPAEPPRLSLWRVLADARAALLDQLLSDEDGPLGWRRNLVPSAEPWSTLSTAYGLKVMAMLGGPDGRTPAVARRILQRADRDADGRIVGWRVRRPSEPSLEMTATAIDALLRVGTEIPIDEVVRILRELLDETALQRPFILTSALEPLLRVAPDSDLAHTVVKALLESRIPFGDVRVWPEKLLSRGVQPLLDVSVAHTARAVAVLRSAPEELVGDAVTSATQWLARTANLDGVYEVIRRPRGEEIDELTIHHFTSAWVARALAGAPVPDRYAIGRALGHVWSRYDPTLHLWAWGNGDVPVWMLADAVDAVQSAALALHDAPFPTGPETN